MKQLLGCMNKQASDMALFAVHMTPSCKQHRCVAHIEVAQHMRNTWVWLWLHGNVVPWVIPREMHLLCRWLHPCLPAQPVQQRVPASLVQRTACMHTHLL